MKLIFLFIFVAAAFNDSFGQAKALEITHYLFPEFAKGTVLMKNGIKNDASLNYNSLTEEMIFENNGKKLAVSQLDKIEKIIAID